VSVPDKNNKRNTFRNYENVSEDLNVRAMGPLHCMSSSQISVG
jgi:hypothetical protein